MKLPFKPYEPEVEFTQTRRRLPHREQPGCTYFVTWRLGDSVPLEVLRQWKAEREVFLHTHPKPWDADTQRTYDQQFERRLERWADEGHGACWLARQECREVMVKALQHFADQRYDLDCFVVMPNHLHVLVRPYAGTVAECDADIPVCTSDPGDSNTSGRSGKEECLLHPSSLAGIMKSWKGFTAREINRMVGRRGPLWMDESFDHAVRSVAQLQRFRDYIRENPTKARLQEGTFACWANAETE